MKKIIVGIIGCGLVIMVSLFILVTPGCLGCAKYPAVRGGSTDDPPGYHPAFLPPRVNTALVVSYHQQAIDAGYRIFNSGGNAFDAFIAVTVVENVVSPGYVTLAGLLGTLIYHAKTNDVIYLDGGYNSVLDPEGAYNPGNPITGKLVVVPGIVAGLAAISSRFGRLSFAQVLQPAIEIARNGFAIDEYYARSIEFAAEKLRGTEYGRRTFFPGGRALQPGDILRQPELAGFLTKLAEQGADYMYRGDWAARCVETVRQQGGLMSMADLASYEPTWTRPWIMSYRGYDICASSGRSMFALRTLLALKTLEHTTVQPLGHFSTSADALEIVVRVARAVEDENWINDYRYLDNRELVNSRLTLDYTNSIWARVQGQSNPVHKETSPGPHTLCSIIADTGGNVVSGKHSINSLAWGPGLFVQGVPLNGSGEDAGRYTGPGKRRTQGAPNFFVFKDGPLRYSCGSFGASNPQTSFQFLVNLLDYGLPTDQAAALPRFGSFPYDDKTGVVEYTKNDLDERCSREIVEVLATRGLYFKKIKRVGFGCIAAFHPDGTTGTGWARR